MKKAYTKIVGDLFHYGHANFFKKIKEVADYLVVQVVEDGRVTAYKRKPVMNQQERIAIIQSCKYVDEVVRDGPKVITRNFMQENGFDFYVYSYNSPEELKAKRSDCSDLPQEMILEIEYTPGISTTEIIQRVLDRVNTKGYTL